VLQARIRFKRELSFVKESTKKIPGKIARALLKRGKKRETLFSRTIRKHKAVADEIVEESPNPA
jgi:hypothetical protein